MSLSDNLRRLPRERVPTIAVGRDLHGFLVLTRMGDCRTRPVWLRYGRFARALKNSQLIQRPPDDVTIICETVHQPLATSHYTPDFLRRGLGFLFHTTFDIITHRINMLYSVKSSANR